MRTSKVEVADLRKFLHTLSGNPYFYDLALDGILTHDRKNQDYGSEFEGLASFLWAAAYANTSPKMVFAVLRGVKFSRAKNLDSEGVEPQNEARSDTSTDTAVYELLEAAFKLTYPELYETRLALYPISLRDMQPVIPENAR